MADLLLEIGCEEIPSGEVDQALSWLKINAEQVLNSRRLKFNEIKTLGTPRRLVLIISDVASRQTDLSEEVTGPKVEVAYDALGNLTKAGLGFVNSKGKKAEDAFHKNTAKGEVIALQVTEKGLAASQILPSVLNKLIKDIPFSKTMQWDETEVAFIRPVRWILCLLGSKVLPVTFGKIIAADKTYGHRFLSSGFKVVKNISGYLSFLEKNWVMLDGDDRRDTILTAANKLAEEVGGILKSDEELLNTVKNLVEYPWPILGHFEKDFLNTPAEILICEMREHQKYFTVVNEKGDLLPAFIVVAGTKPHNKIKLAEGNARVLKARFADGAFYFAEDNKVALADMVVLLDKVVFQKGLGTILDKTNRITSLSETLAQQLSLDKSELNDLKNASKLCKADLVSGVVAQFPELQGVMGSIYALSSGNSAAVCRGIKEHYWPKNAFDAVPSSNIGAIISLADRLDTLVAVMSLGKSTKQGADPYALRRTAIGLIKIITFFSYRLSLRSLIEITTVNLKNFVKTNTDELKSEVLDFILTRARGILIEELTFKGAKNPVLVADAAMAAPTDDLTDLWARALALNNLAVQDESVFKQLAATFKRVGNIVQQASAKNLFSLKASFDKSLLVEPSEIKLAKAVASAQKQFEQKLLNGDLTKHYMNLLKTIAELKPLVDEFFDKVMVMSDEVELRNSRLHLLSDIEQMVNSVANFAKIEI